MADEAGARAEAVQALDAKFTKQLGDAKTELNAGISRVDKAVATEKEARAQAISGLDAKLTKLVGDTKTEINANVNRVDQAVANEAEARASADSTLRTQIGNTNAALAQKMDSWVNASSAGVMYGVNLGLRYNGKEYKAGMNLMLVGEGGNAKSQFLFSADRFAIIPSLERGDLKTLPFVVENNQVFMQSTLIKDGTITNAKIGNFIQSHNWDGNNGWYIGKDGTANLMNARIRGHLEGNSGTLNNITINDTCRVLGKVQANQIEGDVVTMTDRVDKRWPGSGNTSPGTRYTIATIQGMPFERRMVFTGSIAIIQTWRQNVTIRVDETVVWTYDAGNDGKDFETSIFSIRIPASDYGRNHTITIQWPNRGDSGQFRFTGVIAMYKATGTISLA